MTRDFLILPEGATPEGWPDGWKFPAFPWPPGWPRVMPEKAAIHVVREGALLHVRVEDFDYEEPSDALVGQMVMIQAESDDTLIRMRRPGEETWHKEVLVKVAPIEGDDYGFGFDIELEYDKERIGEWLTTRFSVYGDPEPAETVINEKA
jgi:hypothetical protein